MSAVGSCRSRKDSRVGQVGLWQGLGISDKPARRAASARKEPKILVLCEQSLHHGTNYWADCTETACYEGQITLPGHGLVVVWCNFGQGRSRWAKERQPIQIHQPIFIISCSLWQMDYVLGCQRYCQRYGTTYVITCQLLPKSKQHWVSEGSRSRATNRAWFHTSTVTANLV